MRRKRRAHLLKFVFALAALLLFSTPALAHKVNIFAYAEGTKVICEAYYPDGKKVMQSKVEVFVGDEKVAEGKTDSEGVFSFEAKSRSDHRIVLEAGMGHRAEFTLKAGELPEELGSIEENPESEKTKPDVESTTLEAVPVEMDEAKLKKIIAGEVEKKVAPLRKMLAEAKREREKRSVLDILCGLGIIFGLMGIIILVRSRKRKG